LIKAAINENRVATALLKSKCRVAGAALDRDGLQRLHGFLQSVEVG
jgi:hypothetical protein